MSKLVWLLAIWLSLATSAEATILHHWTQLAPENTIVARAIVDTTNCPVITTNHGAVDMLVRAGPNQQFPHTICEARLSGKTSSATTEGRVFALPRPSLQRILVLGDTGCGINDGKNMQPCEDPSQWPFPAIALLAAKTQPDLIIHTGDFHYRHHQCKHNVTPCRDKSGNGWDSWRRDFFTPAAELLPIAPWIMLRGNHEDCKHAWEGWQRMLALDSLHKDCQPYEKIQVLRYAGNNFALLDSASANENKPDQPLSLKMRQDLDSLPAKLRDPGGWLLTHRPLQSTGYQSRHFKLTEPANPVIKQAFASYDFRYLELLLAGHIHLFQATAFADPQLPAQVIVGNGGNDLLTSIPSPSKDLADQITTRFSFGYALFEAKNAGWEISVFNSKGERIQLCHLGLRLVCS